MLLILRNFLLFSVWFIPWTLLLRILSDTTENMTENVQVNIKDWKTILGTHTQERKYHWYDEEGQDIFSIYQNFFDLGEPHMEDKHYTKCNVCAYWCIWWISLVSVSAFLQLWFLQENSIPVLDIHLDFIGLNRAALSYRKFHWIAFRFAD